ncbi:aconitase family protein [Rhizobium ruizarguesonis]
MARRVGMRCSNLDCRSPPPGDRRRGIQHVVSTEQALAQPGIVIVAGDSHSTTQGAVGAVAFMLALIAEQIANSEIDRSSPP